MTFFIEFLLVNLEDNRFVFASYLRSKKSELSTTILLGFSKVSFLDKGLFVVLDVILA